MFCGPGVKDMTGRIASVQTLGTNFHPFKLSIDTFFDRFNVEIVNYVICKLSICAHVSRRFLTVFLHLQPACVLFVHYNLQNYNNFNYMNLVA